MNPQSGMSSLGFGSQYVSTSSHISNCSDSSNLLSRKRKPQSEQESQSMAAAFNSLIYTQCREQLEATLESLRKGKFGSDAATQCGAVKKVGVQFERALKTLTCTSIHLCGIESGGVESPEWFLNFLFRSLLAADSKCIEPSARSIIAGIGSYKSRTMATLAAETSLLELGITDLQAIEKLGDAIHAAAALRLEILQMSLSGEKEMLKQRTSTNFLQKLASAVFHM